MQAHKLTIVIPESHEVTIKLPANLTKGEAEVIVLTATIDPVREGGEREPFRDWLARLHAVLRLSTGFSGRRIARVDRGKSFEEGEFA